MIVRDHEKWRRINNVKSNFRLRKQSYLAFPKNDPRYDPPTERFLKHEKFFNIAVGEPIKHQLQYSITSNDSDQVHKIDFHMRSMSQTLSEVDARLHVLQKVLRRPKKYGISHNLQDNKNHLFKIVCGQGIHSGPKGPTLKFAMRQWLKFYGIEYICSMHHGVFFINAGQKIAKYHPPIKVQILKSQSVVNYLLKERRSKSFNEETVKL